MKKMLVVAGLLASVALPVLAQSAPVGDAGTAVAAGDAGPGKHRGMGGAWQDHRPPMMDPTMMVATRLAAAETAIGIRAEQLDAWRDFSDALLGVIERPAFGPGAGPEAGWGPDAGPGAPFAAVQRLADDFIARGEKAQALSDAITALKAQLTPEQLARADILDRPLLPPPGHGGPADDEGDRPGRHHGDGPGPRPPFGAEQAPGIPDAD